MTRTNDSRLARCVLAALALPVWPPAPSSGLAAAPRYTRADQHGRRANSPAPVAPGRRVHHGRPEPTLHRRRFYEAEEGTYGSFEQTLTDPRANAAQCGCDALVVSSASTAMDYDPWVGMRTERRVQATCIVYEDGPRRAAETAETEPDAPRDWETEEW